jgi:hypothetical protein
MHPQWKKKCLGPEASAQAPASSVSPRGQDQQQTAMEYQQFRQFQHYQQYQQFQQFKEFQQSQGSLQAQQQPPPPAPKQAAQRPSLPRRQHSNGAGGGHVADPQPHAALTRNRSQRRLFTALEKAYGQEIPVDVWLEADPVRHALPQRVSLYDSGSSKVGSGSVKYVRVFRHPAPAQFQPSADWFSVEYKARAMDR